MDLDALILSRLQFAFTIAFHIIFPSFTIGLASFLAVLEGLWLATGNERFKALYLFWVKIFALSFGMGVVSGVVLSYQIGTNWSVFAAVTAPVIGPLLAFEVLAAFFLEASFLGVMLFGWKKVGRGLHFTSTVLVAVGTLISAFWIISANSWMQHPTGFTILADGTLRTTSCSGATMANMPIAIRSAIELSASGPFNSRQAEAAPTTSEVVRYAASVMCANRSGKVGEKITCSQLVVLSVPSARIVKPVGCCIQLLAEMIQKADIRVPRATSVVATKWSRGPTFFQPNSITPRNEASRKKAASTS